MPADDMASELIAASPPKNHPNPGRALFPDGPQPATRPQPRSGLHTSCSSRFTLAHSKARFTSRLGVERLVAPSRSASACATRVS